MISTTSCSAPFLAAKLFEARNPLLRPDDFAGLHHELYALEFGDVGKRITRNGDQIGELSFLHRSDVFLPSEDFCVVEQCGL